MNYLGVAGIVLIIAGILWLFAMAWFPPRMDNRDELTWPEFWIKLLEWASENLARKYLPGVLMIVIGAVLLTAGLTS